MTRRSSYCGGRCHVCYVQRQVRGRAICRGLSWLVAPSAYVLERHLSLNVGARDRSSVIPQGAPPGCAYVRGRKTRVHIGFLGTLARHKGILTLLEAAYSCERAWVLEIAGRGPLGDAVRAAVRGPDRFWGEVEGTQKERFFATIDVLVIPSEWEENAPLVAVEAAVRGIPCVVSDRGGLLEGPHHWVSPSGDRTALRHLLDALNRGSAIADASSTLIGASTRYSWSHHVDRVEALLGRHAMESRR
jgi:glycosyltransferase involved in cell wall biosynthesis